MLRQAQHDIFCEDNFLQNNVLRGLHFLQQPLRRKTKTPFFCNDEMIQNFDVEIF